MLRFKDNQVTGSKFQEWSFSIVHNNSEQSFDSLKHFSHKRKLLFPKFLPVGRFAETEKSQFFFFGFCQKFTRCQKLERTELKIMLSSSKNKEKHNNGRNLGPGRGGKLGKKLPTSILPHWLAACLCAVMMQRKLSFCLDCQQQILTIIPLFLFDVII